MLQVESTGKTLDEAIANGLAELKVSKDNVDIKIIEKGGFFKKAKVVLTVDEEVEQKLKNREEKIDVQQDLEQQEVEHEEVEDSKEEDVVIEKTEEGQENIAQNETLEGLSKVASGVIAFIEQYCKLQNISFQYLDNYL